MPSPVSLEETDKENENDIKVDQILEDAGLKAGCRGWGYKHKDIDSCWKLKEAKIFWKAHRHC